MNHENYHYQRSYNDEANYDSHETRDSRNYKYKDRRNLKSRERSKSREKSKRKEKYSEDSNRNREKRDNYREHDHREKSNPIKYASDYKIDFYNRPTLFDISPPGYELTPVSEFKNLKATGALPVMAIPQGSTIILRARRLYIENLPENLIEDEFIDLVNKEMKEKEILIKSGHPALLLDMGMDKQTAYLEFRTAEEASGALILDGLLYKGNIIKFSRPTDYQPHNGYYFGCPNVFQDTLNKLFVACVPVYLNDEQVRELLTAFGELKAFNLVKDGVSGLSKGYAFCEYRDGSVTDIAIAGLNGMQIADKKLVVQRAVLGSRAGTNLGGIIPSQMQVPGVDPDHIIQHDLLVTEVLCLLNMVSEEELKNDNSYKEILEDIQEECSKYGNIISIEVPRPSPDVNLESIGKVFVEFASKEFCKDAHESLAGRKFGGNMVITSFYDLDKYKRREF